MWWLLLTLPSYREYHHHHNHLNDKTFPSIAPFSFTYPIQGCEDWSLSYGKRWGTLWTTCQSLAGLTQTHTHSLTCFQYLQIFWTHRLKRGRLWTVGGDHVDSMLDSNLGPCYCEVMGLLCCYTVVLLCKFPVRKQGQQTDLLKLLLHHESSLQAQHT